MFDATSQIIAKLTHTLRFCRVLFEHSEHSLSPPLPNVHPRSTPTRMRIESREGTPLAKERHGM